ncbi:hypothetical protein [Pseudoxanthomonas kaohsiungensis]|uniref:HTH cro/C1-type domain-containing protein n=1 Tax=Pseudoxanthomonas kaohsiungensis TaxID=283923 RepID=A0ABW3M262_9GAMM|nr:hypothetical protein [Pseudoxanthomonas kaohsiungensis]
MALLLAAQKHRGVTKQQVASKHDVHGSNLSAFVTSLGAVRNVSVNALERILHDLGAHPDDSLTHGLHRWDLMEPGARRYVDTLADVLRANRPASGHGGPRFLLVPGSPAEMGFILLRPCPVTTVLAKVHAVDLLHIAASLGEQASVTTLEAMDAVELQSSWHVSEHEWIVARSIEPFLIAPIRGVNNQAEEH